MIRRSARTIWLVAAVLALAACGGPGGSGSAGDGETTEISSRTVEHAMGASEISGTPERVVALEWTYVEDLLALGVQPVGVADVEGYREWVNVEPALKSEVEDVGTRQDPNLEKIAALDPDLIVGAKFRNEAVYKELSEIAPTLLFNPYPQKDQVTQFEEMVQTFRTIGKAVNRQVEADEVLHDMQSTFDNARATLEKAGLEGTPFILAQIFTTDAAEIRVFLESSMGSQILEKIGLDNTYGGEFDEYGFNTVSLEGLTKFQDANFLYVVQEDDPFTETMAEDPVWNSLAFVEEDRAYALGEDTWLFGGPLSAELVAEKAVESMTE